MSDEHEDNERGSRTDAELVIAGNALAAEFYASMGYNAKPGFRFDRSIHGTEIMCWRFAQIAFLRLQDTDIEDAVENEEDAEDA